MKTIPRSAALVALCLAAGGIAHAGAVQITVTGQDGQPAPNVVVWLPARSAPPMSPTAAPVTIEQRDLQFSPALTIVRTGTTVRFANRDPYDHHVRSVPAGPLGSIAPAKNFEFRLVGEGTKNRTADVVLDKAGVVGLGCHLHSSMRGNVFVTDTPYFAKTDARGVALIDNVPEGAAEVLLWHPDQLTDQPPQKVTVGTATALQSTQLNFSPKRRRGT